MMMRSRILLFFLLCFSLPSLIYAQKQADFLIHASANGEEGAVKVNWVADCQDQGSWDGDVIIRYATTIDADRIEEGLDSEWSFSDPIPIRNSTYTLTELKDNSKYLLYIAKAVPGQSMEDLQWSEKIKVKTKRGWGISRALILIGALGLFIFGMKIMSDGLQRAAGRKLREMLGSITSNRVKGVITGFFSTAIVQSSSVTTVMTVSLVNAGLLTLRQSAGVMMGANIGTTITAWLIMYLGFKVDISSYALIMIAFGAPLLFMTFSRAKDISNAIIGFAILFLGLQFLKDAVPDLDEGSPIVQFFIDYKDSGILGNIMFVALGALVTIVIQSSSAAMALTLTLVSKNIIPFEVACAMVLGENIGTTITAELASTIGNVHAKRSARIHSMFNLVGVSWMLIIFSLFMEFVKWVVSLRVGGPFDPANPDFTGEGIALFHTLFNLANVFVMIWFVPQLVRIAERTVRSKGADEEFSLDFIGGGLVAAPSVALLNAKKEVAKFGSITSRMNDFTRVLLNDPTRKDSAAMLKKIEKYEEITDRVEVEITDFLEHLSRKEMSPQSSMETRSMLSISNDLERIGDIYFQISKTFERKADQKIYFDPKQRKRLNKMFDLVGECFVVMNENLNSEYGSISDESARMAEERLNAFRDELNKSYLNKVEKSDINIKGGLMYKDIFSQLEKIGDHIINVSEAVAGQV